MPEQTGSLCALPRSTVLSVGHRASICRQNMDNQDSYMVAADARTATTFAFSPGQAHDAQQGREMLGGLVSRISRRPTRRRDCTGMAKGARRNWCIWATCSWTDRQGDRVRLVLCGRPLMVIKQRYEQHYADWRQNSASSSPIASSLQFTLEEATSVSQPKQSLHFGRPSEIRASPQL